MEVFFPAGFTAHIFFVEFHNALELAVGGHHFPDGVADFPGGGLRNADPAGQINGRYPFAGVNDGVHGHNPFPQWQLGAVHRGFGGYSELLFTSAALIRAWQRAFALKTI